MNISSRTPEGTPNRCFLCGHEVRLEPSIDTLDGTCPFCGQLLWFSKAARKTSASVSYEGLIIGAGKQRLGPFPVSLQRALIRAISSAYKTGRLPARADIDCLIMNARNWGDVIRQLNRTKSDRTWAYSAGAFVRTQMKRLFAKT